MPPENADNTTPQPLVPPSQPVEINPQQAPPPQFPPVGMPPNTTSAPHLPKLSQPKY